MLPEKEVPANSVPAAAVIQGGRVLFGVIRRKGSFKRIDQLKSKEKSLTLLNLQYCQSRVYQSLVELTE